LEVFPVATFVLQFTPAARTVSSANLTEQDQLQLCLNLVNISGATTGETCVPQASLRHALLS
jgi:hypothetical protein